MSRLRIATGLLAAAVALAAAAGAQDAPAPHTPGRDDVVSLGFGRSRWRVVLEERQAIKRDAAGGAAVGDLDFAQRWLLRELPQLVPGVESVDVLDRVSARTGRNGTATTRERLLEVVGHDEAVARARRLIAPLLLRPRRLLQVRAWLLRESGAPSATPRVRTVPEAVIERRLAEAAREAGLEILRTTSMQLLEGQEGAMSVGSRHSFVRDFDVYTTYRAVLLEPVVDAVMEGFVFRVGALGVPEEAALAVGASMELTVLRRPMDRLSGTIGPAQDEVAIEKPVVATVTWASDSIVMAPGDGGFIVSGIPYWDPNRSMDEGEPQRIEVLCRITTDGGERSPRSGVVQGFDREARLAFVRFAEAPACSGGEALEFWRAGKRVASGVVRESLGRLVTVALGDGETRAGDEAR